MISKPHLVRLLAFVAVVAALTQLVPALPTPHLSLTLTTPSFSLAVAL